MANYFPCPNPACNYQFDADQLPPAAMVTCPICHTRFPHRAASAETTPAAARAKSSSARSYQPVNRLVQARATPRWSGKQTAIIIVVFVAIVIALLGGTMYTLHRQPEKNPNEPFVDQMFNFRWRLPAEPWSKDDALKHDLGFNAFVYSKYEDADPVAHIGLRCVMLGGGEGVRGPRRGELESEAEAVLQKFDNLHKESIQSTVAKQQVSGYKFDATFKNSPVWGEIYWFSFKGIGYVLGIWSLKDKWDQQQSDLASLRDRFEFATVRDKWAEKAETVVHHSLDNEDYEVEDRAGTWERAKAEGAKGAYVANPTDSDPKATMLFRCRLPDKKKKRRGELVPEADAMVLVFTDGVNSPRDVVDYRQKEMEKKGEKFKFTPLEKQPSNLTIPKSAATIGTFLATSEVESTFQLYYAVSVLKVGSHTVAVVGSCKNGDAEFMAESILDLAASLKPK